MKRKLFLLLCALLTTVGTWAQLTDGTVYWIQDASTGQFISQGDSWATRAVAQDVGGLGFQAVRVSEGVYTLKNIMWNTVKSADLGLGDGQYVDQTPVNYALTASGVGYLVSYNGKYLVNNSAENDYKEKPIATTTDAAAATVWKFLTKSEYDDAIQAYKDSKAATYAANLGYSASTVAALESILSTDFITKDYTSSITNASLASNDNGWTHGKLYRGNDAGGWAVGSGCAEFWNGCGYCKQSVTELPNGLYKVTFVGAYRPDNSGPAGNLPSEKTSSPAFVYANDAKTEFLHWIDVPAKANGRSGITTANGYGQSFYTYVSDGKLDLGIVADGWTGNYNWNTFGQFTLTYYNNQVSPEDAATIITQADDLLTQEMDVTIKSTLLSARNTFDAARTIVNYNALNTAISAAQASADAYAAFAPERTKAIALGMDPEIVETYAPDVNALKVAEYNYVETEYPYAVSLGEWTKVNATDRSGQHWDGSSSSPYSEQNVGWDKDSWTCSYSQYATLPAGKYVFKVAGRKSSNSATLTLKVTNGNEIIGLVNDFPNGDIGKGIDTSGATNFGDGTFANNGTGRGWEWRYVKFTLNEDATVNISITADATAKYQWVGFCNATVQADNDDVIDILAYNIAKASAIAVRDNAQYAAVTGSERVALINAINADPTADYPAATAALNDASAAFIAAAPAYTAFAELNSNVATKLGVALPTITSETVAADLDVNGIIVAEYTAAKSYGTDLTSKLGDWTNAPGTNKGQSWDGTTGDDADTYYDEYNGTDRAMTQAVTLPAGDYALIAKGRASANGLLTVVVGEETVTFPHKGASGYGIATNGDATFADNAIYANDGNGWGWEYRVITFTSDGATPITLTFNWKTASNNWCGLDDIELRINASSANLKVTDGKLGTFVAPFDVTLPQNVKGYIAKVDGSEVKLTKIAEGGNELTAGTPVIVYADGADVDETFYGIPTEDWTIAKASDLWGILSESSKTVPVGAYVLQTQTIEEQPVQAFYKVAAAAPGALNRCYVKVTEPNQNARLTITFDGEDPTAINAIEAAEAEDGALKDGKYLIDGKVILVKNGVKYSANGQILK